MSINDEAYQKGWIYNPNISSMGDPVESRRVFIEEPFGGLPPEKIPPIHRASANLGWCHRTLCSAIYDMRNVLDCIDKATKDDQHLNKLLWVLRTLVEEFQVYGNRMEAGLDDLQELEKMRKEYKELEEQVKKLREEIKTHEQTLSNRNT